MRKQTTFILCSIFFPFTTGVHAQVIEISGSPFATEGAPVPQYISQVREKLILVDPRQHAWGAYSAQGKLIRWGIATAGADWCPDLGLPCRTKTGNFRIYSLGNGDCYSHKFDNAPMPYCMFFNGSEALHGAENITFGNASHGCVRLHVDDAKWLRYQFVEGPTIRNGYRGTLVKIKSY